MNDIDTVKERYDACPERPVVKKFEDHLIIQLWGVELVLQPNGHWFINDTAD